MGKLPKLREVYRGVRKPMAPSVKVEPDRRGKIRKRENGKEIEKHEGRRKRSDNEVERQQR